MTIMQNPNQLFQQAVAMHQRGDFRGAMAGYQQVLKLQPRHPLVLTYLAICEHALGQTAQALARVDAAIGLMPTYPEAHLHRGEMLRAIGRDADAEAAYRRAIELKPVLAAAWLGLGMVLFGQQRFDAALAAFDAAIARDGTQASAWLNKANAQLALGRAEQALQSCEQAQLRQPGLLPAQITHARALIDLRRIDEALALLAPLAEQSPGWREAQLTYAQALDAAGQRESAIERFEACLAANPNDADAYNGIGVVLEATRRWEQAVDHYETALRIRPQQADAWVNLGRLRGRMQQWNAAQSDLQRALALVPEHAEALVELGQLAYELADWTPAERYWQSAAQSVMARPELVIGTRLATLHARVCDWSSHEADIAAFREGIAQRHGRVNPFAVLNWLDDAGLQQQAASAWTRQMYPALTTAARPHAARRPGRTRVAYLSGDFHEHATMYLAARLFELHDRDRFEVWGVSIGPQADDAMRTRAKSAFEHFWDAREAPDDEIVGQLREWDIDIAVDLKGYTKDNRTGVFAQRCAPVQVSYLGYPGTMGADFMDYIIADPVVIPRDQFGAYTERVVWMPDAYQVNDDTRVRPPDGPSRAQMGLPDDAVVLCCFNSAHKLKPAVFDSWMRVLAQVPQTVLWLWADDEIVRDRLRREAAARGVAPQRILFADGVPHHEHLARLRLADLFVDTLPYNAHTTASDALWSGVPVVTQIGNAFAGRVAASLLQAVDLPQLITTSPADYEARILELVHDRAQRAQLRRHLETNARTSRLFDSTRFTRHLESAFDAMMAFHRAGVKRHFKVADHEPGFEELG